MGNASLQPADSLWWTPHQRMIHCFLQFCGKTQNKCIAFIFFEIYTRKVRASARSFTQRWNRCSTDVEFASQDRLMDVESLTRRVFIYWSQRQSRVLGGQIVVFKDYSLSRHYGTKRSEKCKNLSNAEWKATGTFFFFIWTGVSNGGYPNHCRVFIVLPKRTFHCLFVTS